MNVIRTSDEFNLCRQRIVREVSLGDVFPRRVFKRNPVSTKFFDSAYITSPEFFEMLRSLCNEFDEDGFVFGVLKPDPWRFARDNSGFFPAARFSRYDHSSAFLDFVFYGGNDAIAFQVFETVILSNSGWFAAYGKREDEYGVVSTFRETKSDYKKSPAAFTADFLMDDLAFFECIKNFRNFRISREQFIESWGNGAS
jgi:hypothetical protein